jgi:DNA gyrase inhibitor GyrI
MSSALLIVIVLIAGVLGLLAYYDVLFSKKVTHEMLPHSMILYREWQGDMDKVGEQFKKLGMALYDKLSSKEARLFGLYFDIPDLLNDPKEARCAIGFILDTEEQKRLGQEIASQNSHYKTGVFPKTMTLSVKYRYRNSLSILLLAHFWKKVMNHLKTEGLKRHPSTPFLEIYDLRCSGDGHFHLHYALENPKDLSFSSIPKPAGLELSK